MINVDFSTDIWRMKLWGRRMGVDLHETKQLIEPYAWSQCHLVSMATHLIEFHGFHYRELSDSRMLFSLVCDPRACGVGEVPTLTGETIELPVHATSFFSPARRKHWESVFHSPLWTSTRSTKVPGYNTAGDILHLVQALLPGMILIVELHDGWSTQRGIPPYSWVCENKDILVSCIGTDRYDALREAASDTVRAVINLRDLTTSGQD